DNVAHVETFDFDGATATPAIAGLDGRAGHGAIDQRQHVGTFGIFAQGNRGDGNGVIPFLHGDIARGEHAAAQGQVFIVDGDVDRHGTGAFDGDWIDAHDFTDEFAIAEARNGDADR